MVAMFVFWTDQKTSVPESAWPAASCTTALSGRWPPTETDDVAGDTATVATSPGATLLVVEPPHAPTASIAPQTAPPRIRVAASQELVPAHLARRARLNGRTPAMSAPSTTKRRDRPTA